MSLFDKILLHPAQFEIHTDDKIGVTGANDCGKSTLTRLVADLPEGLRFAPGMCLRLFDQQLDLLNSDETILQMRLISLEEALRQQPENQALRDQRDALIVQLRQFI